MKIVQFKKHICTALIVLFVGVVQAQIPNNLTKVKSEQITDAQLKQFTEQAQKSGMTEADVLSEIKRKGLSDVEIAKLQARFQQFGVSEIGKTDTEKQGPTRDKLPKTKVPEQNNNAVTDAENESFGSYLFKNSKINFEPNLRIPTPLNYKLGIDDELIIDIYGANEKYQNTIIDPEGFIRLAYAGKIFVNGLTIEEATARIRSKMASIYPGLKSGVSRLSVSLGSIRSINVTIMGSAGNPGTYTLSSLATVFNALYASGGPNEYGSFREIELIRNNKVVQKIDVYKFLLYGDQSQNIRLEDMDVIHVPIAKTQVFVNGEIKRKAVFELLPQETLSTLINDFAAGFQNTAYRASIQIIRITDRQKKIIDVPINDFSTFNLETGDIVNVAKIIDAFENAVSIYGPVLRPGIYAVQTGMRISDLISKADGLLADVYKDRALLYRLKEDNSKELLSISLNEIFADSAKNILLEKNDQLVIYSLSEFNSSFNLNITGAVRKPGSFEFFKGITLKDLIMKAGGFLESATHLNFSIARRKNNVDPNNANAFVSEIISLKLDSLSLNAKELNFLLEPNDIISVKEDPFKKQQEFVTVTGKVLLPGTYAMEQRGERISSIIKRAGGVLNEGNVHGAILRRKVAVEKEKEKEEIVESVKKIALMAKDSSNNLIQQFEIDYNDIVIDLEKAINHPGSLADILVKKNDELIIPEKDQMVSVVGEVLHPVSISFDKRRGVPYYINAAGGFGKSAHRKKVFVVYSNGKAAKTRYGLGLVRFYPRIKEGTKIFVPRHEEDNKRKSTPAETAATLGSLATMISGFVLIISQIIK